MVLFTVVEDGTGSELQFDYAHHIMEAPRRGFDSHLILCRALKNKGKIMKIGDLVIASFKYLDFGNAIMDVQGKRGIWDRENFIQYCTSIPSKKNFRRGEGVYLYVLDVSPESVKLEKTVADKKVEFIISLKDNNTGEIKEIEWISEPHSGLSEGELIEDTELYWTEGGYSCDCNRFSEFYNKHEEDTPCGNERFKLLSIRRKTPEGLVEVPIQVE
jgi:hypothetical protein